MFKNHFKFSIRNLWKNKTLSLLNLIGLSIGVSSVLTLLFSVYSYYSADDTIGNTEDVVYLKTILKDGNDYRSVPYPLMDAVVSSSPDIKTGTHLHGWGNMWLETDDKDFQERTDYVDPEFLQVLNIPLKYGNAETALKEKYSIILTEKVSQKIFGDINPVGRTLIGADTLNLRITGVFEPISPYASLRLGVVLPNTLLENNPTFIEQADWDNSFSPVFFKLHSGADKTDIKSRIEKIVEKHYDYPDTIAGIQVKSFSEMRMDIVPVVDIIISSSIVASLFILLIILVNLLNLNTSTMLGRVKNISVRKVLGSSKRNVVFQYCIENGILVLVSIFISGLLFLLVNLPRLNDTFGPEFGRISFNFFRDYPVIISIFFLGVLATLMVSVLPSLRFIKIPITLGIKGKIEQVKRNFLVRNSFIILQFTIAILFISIAVILNRQISFMKNADLGFERNNLLVSNIDLDYKNLDVATSQFNALITGLETNSYVNSVSTSEAIPSDYYFNYTSYYNPENDKSIRMRRSYADDSYFKTLKVPIVEGRDFDKTLDQPNDFPVIINEAALQAFGWNSIEGKRLKFKDSEDAGLPIVGVVKDFHYQDLQNDIEPLVHIYRDRTSLDKHRYLTVSVAEGHESDIEALITNTFASINTRKTYVQERLVDKVSGQYLLIEGMLKSVNITAVLAIFISCLGLFGLISFSAKRKIKEIGVRKVLGASVSKIVILLSKDYIILVAIATVIALPLAWYIMNSWLHSFAYSIAIKWWMLALATLITLVITSFTLALRAVKSATANPVKSLRSE